MCVCVCVCVCVCLCVCLCVFTHIFISFYDNHILFLRYIVILLSILGRKVLLKYS